MAGADIFNPNTWTDATKGIVQSCWTEDSVLRHCVGQITDLCKKSRDLCQKHVETIQDQWRTAHFDLEKVIVYGQVPDLHMRIEAFLAGVKTLLDLLAQLLSSEKIVGGVVDGFHRAQDTYGGKVLNALDNNSLGGRKDVAAKVRALIVEHKALWIDEAIRARDQLIHPEKGMHQLMFQLDFVARGDTLACESVNPPMIGAEVIDRYAQRVLTHAHVFSSSLLRLLREAAMSNSGMEPTR